MSSKGEGHLLQSTLCTLLWLLRSGWLQDEVVCTAGVQQGKVVRGRGVSEQGYTSERWPEKASVQR